MISVPDGADDRIRLRAWTEHDVDALVEAWTDPEIVRFSAVPDDVSPAAATRWLAGTDDRRRAGLAVDAVVSPLTGDEVWGEVGLGPLDLDRGVANLGFWIHRDQRGQGLGQRAARLLVEWVDRTMPIGVMVATTDEANPASGRVLAAVGFDTFEPGRWVRRRHRGI